MTTTTDIKLICTARGEHADVRAEIDTARVRSDGSFELVKTREVAAPWSAIQDAQIAVGEFRAPAPHRVPRLAHRQDFEGRRRWRLRCDQCPLDVPLTEATLSTVIAWVVANDKREIDLSVIDKYLLYARGKPVK